MTSDPCRVTIYHGRPCPAPFLISNQCFTVCKHYLLILLTGSLQSTASVCWIYSPLRSLAPLLHLHLFLIFFHVFPLASVLHSSRGRRRRRKWPRSRRSDERCHTVHLEEALTLPSPFFSFSFLFSFNIWRERQLFELRESKTFLFKIILPFLQNFSYFYFF